MMRIQIFWHLLFASCVLALTSCATTKHSSTLAAGRPKVLAYPFDYCAVIKKPFGEEGAKYSVEHDGFQVQFCCLPCIKAFDTNPEAFMPPIRNFYANPENLSAAESHKEKPRFRSGGD